MPFVTFTVRRGLREVDRNRRRHCGRSGQTIRRAPTPRASGHPIRLPRGGAEPPVLCCCVDQARGDRRQLSRRSATRTRRQGRRPDHCRQFGASLRAATRADESYRAFRTRGRAMPKGQRAKQINSPRSPSQSAKRRAAATPDHPLSRGCNKEVPRDNEPQPTVLVFLFKPRRDVDRVL
jgi:hypothetical protein